MKLPGFLHIKKLDLFIIKSFSLLLAGTFFICLFIFIIQLLWRWVDEFVGKGLDLDVLAQFFYLGSLTLVGQALPLAILLAALMTFGNFGERLELLAMKAAGIPLLRIMAPLAVECILLGCVSFYFQNVVGPNAQVKLYTVLYSIKQTSPEVEIPEGVFYDKIEGFNLFVKHKDKESGMLYNVMIYDLREGFDKSRILVADSGKMETSADQKHMTLKLYSGELFENLQMNKKDNRKNKNVPYRRETYREKIVMIELDGGFSMQDGSFLKTQAASKNMIQLKESIDSLTIHNDSIGMNNWKSSMRNSYQMKTALSNEDSIAMQRDAVYSINVDSIYNTASKVEKLRWKRNEYNKLQQIKTEYEIKKNIMRSLDKDLNKHHLMWWEKITLSLGCVIFFFIGAPLGAIVRKGGLGYPVLISVATFVLYYIFNTSGYKMAREGEWYIWVGGWLSTIILTPLGILFTYQSNRDSTILNIDAYKEFFRKLLGIKDKRHIALKEVIIEDPDYTADYKKLDEIIHISHKFRKENKLKRLPSLKRIFFGDGNENVIVNMGEELDILTEEMGNSKSKKVIILINEIPIIEAKAITSPIKNKWLNILTIVLFPVGCAIYIRSCIYRLRLLRDLIKLEQTAKKLMDRLIKEKLV
ncbi:MAG: LptF/LptG family permease [Bacteroidaceae bacterium]|nr:LptF/LptG family permease [Bacteroidaceae bacterium]